MDKGTLMGLSMTTSKKVYHSKKLFQIITFNYNPNCISLNPSIYSFVPLVD